MLTGFLCEWFRCFWVTFCQFPISLFSSPLPLETTPNPEVMQLQGVIQDLENQIEEHKSKILNTANAVLKVRELWLWWTLHY